MRAVVIGTGPAGITASLTLRQLDPTGSVVALSVEPYPPYSPPAMADHFLSGRTATLYWKGTDIAARSGVEERRGSCVTGIDVDHREVVLADGPPLPFDGLVIASGSRLHAPLAGADLPGVSDFKSLSTAEKLIGKVRRGEASSAVIVGNGFVGVELALLLADLGVDVTLVGRRGWVMPRVLDQRTAEVAERELERRGVTLRLGVQADSIVGPGFAAGVRLQDGRTLRGDLIVAATGVKPHTEFLAGAGISIGWGIHVDDRLRTSSPLVVAAGDVAEAADWLTGQRYVHAIFPNAVAQARIAAANLCGADVRYDGAEAMNSLKHLGVPIVAMGTMESAEEVLRWEDRRSVRSIYLNDGRIIGAQMAGDIRAAGVYRSLMLRRVAVSKYGRRLVEPEFGTATLAFAAVEPGSYGAPSGRSPVVVAGSR